MNLKKPDPKDYGNDYERWTEDCALWARSPAALLDFLKAWLEWAEGSAEDGKPFSRGHGICSAAHMWSRAEVFATSVTDYKLLRGVKMQLEQRLTGGSLYPFGGYEMYLAEGITRKAFKNVERLAWVRKTIKELEDEVRT